MTDTQKLTSAIAKSGIKLTVIAKKIGVARETLYKKINNETEFKASEISAMKKILNLSNQDRDRIFFEE